MCSFLTWWHTGATLWCYTPIVFAKGTWRQTWGHTCWNELWCYFSCVLQPANKDTCTVVSVPFQSHVSLIYKSLLPVSCTSADREVFLCRRMLQRVLVWMVRSCVDVTVCTHRAQCSDYNGPIKLPHLLVCPSPSPLLPSALSPSYPVFIRLCDFLIPLFSSSVWKLTLLRVIMEGPGLLIIWRDHHRDPRPCSPKPLML